MKIFRENEFEIFVSADRISPKYNIFFSQIISFLPVTLAVALFAVVSMAQPPTEVPDEEPPPLKIITLAERQKLNAETDIKERTKLSLELMGGHLTKAEVHHGNQEYKEMFGELGRFQAILENSLFYLNQVGGNQNKILYNFKRLEIGIRAFGPRLAVIRREVPLRYDPYLKYLSVTLRDARSKAVEPLFGNRVVPNQKQ